MSIIFSTVNVYKFENLNDYFPKQHQPAGLSNEEAMFPKVQPGLVMLHELISGLTGLIRSIQSLHLAHTAAPHKLDILYFQ
jgi:hypothetical protein